MRQNAENTHDLLSAMLSEQAADAMAEAEQKTEFGQAHLALAYKYVFGDIWMRPGLDLRSRSLLTLGILIARDAGEELNIHIRTALKNGVTVQEIEEVLLHATAYAGFASANAARVKAIAILKEDGHI